MVTHNPELALKYSTRIIRLKDGEIVEDSNPVEKVKTTKKQNVKNSQKSKLGLMSAFWLSAKNLISKIKRTAMVCVAGSIGIIGVASVLAVSTGVNAYINNMQNDMLSGNPITIQETAYNMNALMSMSNANKQEAIKKSVENGYVNVDNVVDVLVKMNGTISQLKVQNSINQEYIDYILQMPSEYYASIKLSYGLNLENNIFIESPFIGHNKKQISITAVKDIYTSILSDAGLNNYASLVSTLEDNFLELPNNKEYILSQYDIISSNGDIPTKANELAIVVNEETELSNLFLAQLGYLTQEEFLNVVYKASDSELYNPQKDVQRMSYEDLLGKKFVWYSNNNVFTPNYTSEENYNESKPFNYNFEVTQDFSEGQEFVITSILRPKKGLSYGSLTTGVYYTNSLTQQILQTNAESKIVKYLTDSNKTNIVSGDIGKIKNGIYYTYNYEFENSQKTGTSYLGSTNSMMSALMSSSQTANYYTLTKRELGGENLPNKISIYPVNFEVKDNITKYLDQWNKDGDIVIKDTTLTKDQRNEIQYSDNLALVITMISSMVNMITIALVAFTGLSLVVSTVMISIITYVSVIERIKEIGVIRALGGRKKDVSRLFIAESVIIGGTSGLIGVLVTFILSILINLLAGINIAILNFPIIISMMAISILLTLMSGVVPARIASKKDPVVALRTE